MGPGDSDWSIYEEFEPLPVHTYGIQGGMACAAIHMHSITATCVYCMHSMILLKGQGRNKNSNFLHNYKAPLRQLQNLVNEFLLKKKDFRL